MKLDLLRLSDPLLDRVWPYEEEWGPTLSLDFLRRFERAVVGPPVKIVLYEDGAVLPLWQGWPEDADDACTHHGLPAETFLELYKPWTARHLESLSRMHIDVMLGPLLLQTPVDSLALGVLPGNHMLLPGTWEEYLTGLDGPDRREIRSALRHLEQDYTLDFEAPNSEEFLRLLEYHLAYHTKAHWTHQFDATGCVLKRLEYRMLCSFFMNDKHHARWITARRRSDGSVAGVNLALRYGDLVSDFICLRAPKTANLGIQLAAYNVMRSIEFEGAAELTLAGEVEDTCCWKKRFIAESARLSNYWLASAQVSAPLPGWFPPYYFQGELICA